MKKHSVPPEDFELNSEIWFTPIFTTVSLTDGDMDLGSVNMVS